MEQKHSTCWVSTEGTTPAGWISGSEHFATPVQLCLSKLNMETGLCLLVPSALTAESCLGTSSKESKVFFSSF